MSFRPLRVFCDFDGTITTPDTLEFLTGRFGGGPELYRETGRLLRSGAISLRDGIARDMESLRVPFDEAAAALRAEVQVDPGFPRFARWCAEHDVPLTILSAGYAEIIELLLPPDLRAGADVRANRFVPGTWRTVFRDASPEGHDKAAAVRAARAAGCRAVFIGDGFSDRGPAREADVVFARRGRSLVSWCAEQGIACEVFASFDEVQRSVAALLRTAA
jgi:2,3-diketo-5-methylthio-1-phosphopentane phosphatase